MFYYTDIPDKILREVNFDFWISMLIESRKYVNLSDINVLDFGCGSGGFLQLLKNFYPNAKGLGVDLDETLIFNARNNNNYCEDISYSTKLEDYQNPLKFHYDYVFSQEVLYTISELSSHASNIFNLLRPSGIYFATMGCHIQNPLWSHRRSIIRDEEKYYAYDYSIDEVARIFYDVGFRVSIKRLPMYGSMTYSSTKTESFSRSLYDLVKNTEEHKMLFIFLKPDVTRVTEQ